MPAGAERDEFRACFLREVFGTRVITRFIILRVEDEEFFAVKRHYHPLIPPRKGGKERNRTVEFITA